MHLQIDFTPALFSLVMPCARSLRAAGNRLPERTRAQVNVSIQAEEQAKVDRKAVSE